MGEEIENSPPQFRREKYFWVAEIRLPAFAGYRKTRTPRRSLDDARSDGSVTLFVEPSDNVTSPLSSEQNAALRFLVSHQDQISLQIANALFERYPAIREDYLEFTEEDEEAEVLPSIATPEGLKDLIGLANVHLLLDHVDAMSYVGFEFGCTWDVERGLGVMTHGGRIIAIGQAQNSFELSRR